MKDKHKQCHSSIIPSAKPPFRRHFVAMTANAKGGLRKTIFLIKKNVSGGNPPYIVVTYQYKRKE